MSSCELCGKETSNLKKALIVGSKMSVCTTCSSKGEIIDSKKDSINKIFYKRKKNYNTDNFEIIENYISIINKSIALKKLDIHKLARVIGVKESILFKVLSGKLKIDLSLAKKLEKYLNINLIKKIEEKNKDQLDIEELKLDESEASFSLGDLIKKELNKKK